MIEHVDIIAQDQNLWQEMQTSEAGLSGTDLYEQSNVLRQIRGGLFEPIYCYLSVIYVVCTTAIYCQMVF